MRGPDQTSDPMNCRTRRNRFGACGAEAAGEVVRETRLHGWITIAPGCDIGGAGRARRGTRTRGRGMPSAAGRTAAGRTAAGGAGPALGRSARTMSRFPRPGCHWLTAGWGSGAGGCGVGAGATAATGLVEVTPEALGQALLGCDCGRHRRRRRDAFAAVQPKAHLRLGNERIFGADPEMGALQPKPPLRIRRFDQPDHADAAADPALVGSLAPQGRGLGPDHHLDAVAAPCREIQRDARLAAAAAALAEAVPDALNAPNQLDAARRRNPRRGEPDRARCNAPRAGGHQQPDCQPAGWRMTMRARRGFSGRPGSRPAAAPPGCLPGRSPRNSAPPVRARDGAAGCRISRSDRGPRSRWRGTGSFRRPGESADTARDLRSARRGSDRPR
jgi:hypothetical protein